MIKKYYKEEQHEVVSKHKVGNNLFCDGCKKQIGDNIIDGYLPAHTRYLKVDCGNYDWGYDFMDSFEHKHFCSNKCMSRHQKNFWSDNDSSVTAFYEIRMNIWSEDIYIPDGTEEVIDIYD